MDHWFYRAASQRASLESQNNPQSAPPQFVEQVFTETLNWLKRNLNNSTNVNSNAVQNLSADKFLEQTVSSVDKNDCKKDLIERAGLNYAKGAYEREHQLLFASYFAQN